MLALVAERAVVQRDAKVQDVFQFPGQLARRIISRSPQIFPRGRVCRSLM